MTAATVEHRRHNTTPSTNAERRAVWLWAVKNDPRLSDLARRIALDAYSSPKWPAPVNVDTYDATEAEVWEAIDQLVDSPRYLRLMASDLTLFVNIQRDNVWRRADHLAARRDTVFGNRRLGLVDHVRAVEQHTTDERIAIQHRRQ